MTSTDLTLVIRLIVTVDKEISDDDYDEECFTATFVHMVGYLNGPSQGWNNLQICPLRDLNTGGSDLWSDTLPLDHGGAHKGISEEPARDP